MAGPAPLTMGSTASRTLDGVGLRLTEARFPADLRLGLHEHDRPSLVVMLAGAMDDELCGRIRPCRPSTVLVEPAGARHANRFGPQGGRVLVVQPAAELTEMPGAVTTLFGDVHHAPAPAVARLGWRISDELREPDDLTPMLASGLAQEMMALVARADRPRADRPRAGIGQPRWLTSVEELVHASLARPISLDELASSAGVHPVHLGRTFRRYRGMPLGEWVRRLRLERALARLSRSSDSIADIAAASGFADQSHLTRVMQRRLGVTPADYRRLARGR
jgi:AraC family transcriptional regulator